MTENGCHVICALAPKLVAQVADLIQIIRARGITVLLVEQNARLALQISDRAYLGL